MSDRQRIVLAIGLVGIVLMGLYPPWIYVRTTTREAKVAQSVRDNEGYTSGVVITSAAYENRGGYDWIWSDGQSSRIDILTLLVQWIAWAAAIGLFSFWPADSTLRSLNEATLEEDEKKRRQSAGQTQASGSSPA